MENNLNYMHANDTNKQRKILIIIMSLPLILMIFSYTLMYFVDNKKLDLVSLLGTKTIGNLFEPVKSITELPLKTESGDDFIFANEAQNKWTLLVLNSAICGERCEDNLIKSRQMHVALGKAQGKLRRYQIYLDGELHTEKLSRLHKHHPKLKTLYAEKNVLQKLLAEQGVSDFNDVAYLLVDKRGWIMMYYTEAINERDIMKKDLQHLFKYAQ